MVLQFNFVFFYFLYISLTDPYSIIGYHAKTKHATVTDWKLLVKHLMRQRLSSSLAYEHTLEKIK